MGTQNGKTSGNHGDIKSSLVMGHSSQGVEIHGTLVHLEHHAVAFEICSPFLQVRVSEALNDFKIVVHDHVIYSGRAVVRSIFNTGLVWFCEAVLSEHSWTEIAAVHLNGNGKQPLAAGFQEFIRDWQNVYRISPEYKIIVADIQTFLADLCLWLNRVELGIRSLPAPEVPGAEMEVAQQLRESVIGSLTNMFEQFESVTDRIEPGLQAVHRAFGQRQLHAYLLCAPFIHRTYSKPLGYAGDYEMMNMIVRNGFEGASLYAKLVNSYLLDQAPAHAVRNRVSFLTEKIIQETSRIARTGSTARIYNVACGPAWEVQNFLAEHPLAERARFDLLDFNEETLQFTGERLDQVKRRHSRNTPIKMSKKSVHHMLKEKEKRSKQEPAYDLIYCSGLYDYLSDRVCKSLNSYLYEQLMPGGLLVIGNFAPSTPIQNFMGHFLEWFLIYRTSEQLAALAPDEASADNCKVIAEPTGTNIFLEVRKPK